MNKTLALLAVAHCAMSARPALADDRAPSPDKADDASCRSVHSLWNPVPAACLDPIETDRPHKTDTPATLAAGHAQIEMAVLEYAVERLTGSSDDSLGLFNNSYKLGLTDRVDIQAMYATGTYAIRSRRFAFDQQLLLRSKLNVVAEDQAPVALTLVPAVVLPVRRGATTEGGGFLFLGAELPGHLDLEFNTGALSETDPATGRRHAAPVVTAALTRKVADAVSAFVELYADTTSNHPNRWNGTVDAGVLVALGADVQLDAGAYVGAFGTVPAVTPFFGVSARR